MIAKPEKTMNESEKSLVAFSPFTSAPNVVLTKKITKKKIKQKSIVSYSFCPAKLGLM